MMNSLLQNSELESLKTDAISDAEKIEGLDSVFSDGWGDYPLDSVFIRKDTRTVKDVVARISSNRYVMNPEFQRDFVWSEYKQSKLIESCLMRIPLPVFYVAEMPDGRIAIVDGLQRLSTFQAFCENKLKLSFGSNGVESKLNKLNGLRFKELPIKLQERIEDTQLTMFILDEKAPQRAKLDIFERVNSGLPLSRQQMRNALFCGPGTIWLKIVAEGVAFQDATGGSLNKNSMRDREAINRFVSFTLCGLSRYSGDMDDFLAHGLIKLSEFTEIEREELKKQFESAMTFCYEIFGEHCFRKSMLSDDNRKSMINISLFDVMSVYFTKNIDDLKKTRDNRIRYNVVELLRDPEFDKSITISTNSTKAVQYRYNRFDDVFSPMPEDLV